MGFILDYNCIKATTKKKVEYLLSNYFLVERFFINENISFEEKNDWILQVLIMKGKLCFGRPI